MLTIKMQCANCEKKDSCVASNSFMRKATDSIQRLYHAEPESVPDMTVTVNCKDKKLNNEYIESLIVEMK